jgi:catechol-2,3-dioxygenase
MTYPKFVDHVVFRVADPSRSEKFYTALLGPPRQQNADSNMYQVGDTRLFFTRCERPRSGNPDKEEIGFNHLAFGVQTLADLRKIQAQLDAAGISHSGITIDYYGNKEFIWLDDPDGLRVEFYLRPSKVALGAHRARGSKRTRRIVRKGT